MIAIPNMGRPQNCAECPMSALSEFSGIVCKLNRNNNKNNCPIIEIIEDEYAKDILEDCYKIIMCANYGNLTERWVNVGLIGERRIDVK